MNHLGPILRQAREAAGITQQQVADHLGKTRPYVSRVEAGTNTTTDALFAWADFLGLRVLLAPKQPAHSGFRVTAGMTLREIAQRTYVVEGGAETAYLHEPPAEAYDAGPDAALVHQFIAALPKLTPRERIRFESELRMVIDDK